MRPQLFFFAIFLLHLHSSAQLQTEWVKTMGGIHTEYAYDLAIDSQGSMIILGAIDDYFGGETCDLDPGPDITEHTSSADGWSNLMLAKYDSLGNHLWSFSLWDEALDPAPNKIDLDADDNIYLTGTLTRAVDIDPGPDTYLLDANEGDYATLFAIKYSSDGELIWGDIFGGNSFCYGHQILVENGAVYLCGEATNTVYPGFNDSTVITNIWSDYFNGFIAKYDLDMNHIWSGAIAAGNGGNNEVTSIDVDQEGALFASGVFHRTADFDPDPDQEFTLYSPLTDDEHSADMFIAKYASDGSLITAVSIGSEIDFERVEEVFDLKVDNDGNVLVTGWYSGLIDFDAGSGISNLTGDNDIFLAKYNSDLEFVWAFSLAGTYYDIGKEIEVDDNNDIYLHGQYYWNGDFDPGPDEFIISGDWGRGFLAKYTENGQFITAVDLPISQSFGYEMHGMELGDNGAVYLAGYFYGEQDFDLDEDDELLIQSNNNSNDLFLGKFQYYDPVDHYLASVEPSQIVDEGVVTLHIDGYDMEEVLDVRLVMGTDSLHHESFNPVSDFSLDVVFGLESETPGMYDLMVETEDSVMVLADAVEILPAVLNSPDARIEYLSALRVLLNREEPSIGLLTNTGPKDLVAFPVIYRQVYEAVGLENLMPVMDLRTHTSFAGLSAQLTVLGLNDSSMNDIVFPSNDGDLVAMLIPHLSTGDERLLHMRMTYADLIPSDYFIIPHANGLLESEALLPGHSPSPTPCMTEMVTQAISIAAPGLELTDVESCFNSTYAETQAFLMDAIQSTENAQEVIPLRGVMMKVGMDIIQCMDPTYEIDALVLDSMATQMVQLLGTPIIFGPDLDCSEYVEASTLFKSLIEEDEENDAPHYEMESIQKSQTTAQCQAMGITSGYGCTDFTKPCIDPQSSLDPNEKYGPVNPESATHHINDRNGLQYSIHFENVDSATIAAKQVVIIDSLDTEAFDLSSMQFQYASWGDSIVAIDKGVNYFDLRPTHPNILKITASLDTLTGVARWDFETLDTLTMLLTFDIDQGFLPPNVNSPEGMGFVTFTIDLKEEVESGTSFENDALIYFDYNDPILTPAWENTFDNISPASHVNDTFEMADTETFTLSWESDDPDDPPMLYAILVSENVQGEWQVWQDFTSETSADYEGVIGSTYYFLSIAADSAMNIEVFPSTHDAMFTFLPDALDEHENIGFSLSPNPAEDIITLQFQDTRFQGVRVIDPLGHVVDRHRLSGRDKFRMDISGLAKGVYLIRCETVDGEWKSRRMVKR